MPGCQPLGRFPPTMPTRPQVNVLAPFALTAHLLGSVRERIVNVASLSASSRIVVSERLHEARGHEAYSCRQAASCMRC